MKSLLVVACLVLAAAVKPSHGMGEKEKFMDAIQDSVKPCLEEQNIDESEMVKFDDNNLEGDEKTKFGCLKACIMKRLNMLEGSTVKPEGLKDVLDKVYDDDDAVAAELQAAEECVKQVEDENDECELAFKYSSCIHAKFMEG